MLKPHYADLAELINELKFDESLYLLKLIDSDKTSDVLTELDDDLRERVLKNFPKRKLLEKLRN